ncbi:hypothetical protein ABT390_13505 [Streptomyces aurantiacus]|uniref:DUF7426 domain-containing protein n=1 Tax=Streptomyces aurantiacus JA 4570 TaxID=1286094 RepID=S3ZCI3_9ACTN|nr:hypothetical protein [Streptomyces aurantiacus]EPH40334.1 hypothetical protein STRAU_6597 [Streptomyces aurantiacus JA 4570]
MAFEALDELLDETLILPIGGRRYTIPAPSADTGLRVQTIVQAAAVAASGGQVDEEALGDAAEGDLYRDLLGDAYDEMLDNGVTWPALKHAARTAIAWVVQDKAAAERVWSSGGDPSRLAPNRQQRRSGGANTTKSAASSSGTSGRPAPARARRKRR